MKSSILVFLAVSLAFPSVFADCTNSSSIPINTVLLDSPTNNPAWALNFYPTSSCTGNASTTSTPSNTHLNTCISLSSLLGSTYPGSMAVYFRGSPEAKSINILVNGKLVVDDCDESAADVQTLCNPGVPTWFCVTAGEKGRHLGAFTVNGEFYTGP